MSERIAPALRVAREKLCIAQTDMPHEAHRSDLQTALNDPGWSRFNSPPLPGDSDG